MFVNLRIEKFLSLHKRLSKTESVPLLTDVQIKHTSKPFALSSSDNYGDPVPAAHIIVKSRYADTLSQAYYFKGVGNHMGNYLVFEWSCENWYGSSNLVSNLICLGGETDVYVRDARKIRSWINALRKEWVNRYQDSVVWPSFKPIHLSNRKGKNGFASNVRQTLSIEIESMMDCISDLADACDPYLSEGDYEETIALLASKTIFGGIFSAHAKLFDYNKIKLLKSFG